MTDDTMLRTTTPKTPKAKSHPDSWEPELAEGRQRQALARQMGGPERVERQHKGGRLTVRERIDRMLDPGTFKEIGSIAGKATYDAKGNLTTLASGGPVCHYDSENRLVSQTGGSGATLAYYPDGSLWQTTGSVTTEFLYDGDQIIGEVSRKA